MTLTGQDYLSLNQTENSLEACKKYAVVYRKGDEDLYTERNTETDKFKQITVTMKSVNRL